MKSNKKQTLEERVKRIYKEEFGRINPAERVLDGFTYQDLIDEVVNANLEITEKNVRHIFEVILSQLTQEAKTEFNKNIKRILTIKKR